MNIPQDFENILLDEGKIQTIVRSLAARISADYADKDLHIVALLKGGFIFLADLTRFLNIQATMDFIVVSSYSGSRASGGVRILKDLDYPIKNRHVLFVEDIIDNGATAHFLLQTLRLRKPASLKICSLLDKPSRRTVDVKADYVGYEAPDEFVVGYGMDFNERYRNLPYIAALRKEVYGRI